MSTAGESLSKVSPAKAQPLNCSCRAKRPRRAAASLSRRQVAASLSRVCPATACPSRMRPAARVPIRSRRQTESMPAGRVLIIEDEDKLRRVIQLHLSSAGFEVDTAASAEQAMPMVEQADVILTDLRLPGSSGMQLMKEAQARSAEAAVVMMTAHGSVEAAVEAMKLGASDFLEKPFSLDHLTTILNKALAVR